MKSTMWTELKSDECKPIKVDMRDGHIQAVQIKHPLLPRALYFTKSAKGNWYWRSTGRENDTYADGYIIRGDLIIPDGLPMAYPQFANPVAA